jgi:hypothetical protein
MKIKINWEIEDGYIGKSRPQKSIFNSNDYVDDAEWNELSEQEKENYIDEFMQEEFLNKIIWYERSREIIEE